MKIIPFDRRFKRDQFSCGRSSLDQYILRNATRDVKSRVCSCFVIVDSKDQVIAYYTLSSAGIPKDGAPEELEKQIAYPQIPVILLGRLAVDHKYHGKGLGKILLVDALARCLKVADEQIGSLAVIVDPIDREAERFYSKYGFTKIPDRGRMFMTMRKIRDAFEMAGK